jgi:hypothetical protein
LVATDCVHALLKGEDSDEARVGASLIAAACMSLLPEKL